MNSAKNVNITERAKTIRDTTQESWSCYVPSTQAKEPEALVPASTTEPEGLANKKADSSNRLRNQFQ